MWVDVGRIRLWVELDGEGPPALLLHGLGSCAEDWALQRAALGRRYRLIVPDLRGHGRSSRAIGLWTVEDMGRDVAALLDWLEIESAHVLGLSMGGCVALTLALSCPERVRSLVLVNTGAVIRPGGRKLLRVARRLAALAAGGPAAMASVIAEGLFPGEGQERLRREAERRLAQVDVPSYLCTLLALARYDVRRRLGEIACPTLVMAGARDATLGTAPAQLLAERIPGARLIIVPDSGHATPLDQPHLFNRLVRAFWAEVDASRAEDVAPEPAAAPR